MLRSSVPGSPGSIRRSGTALLLTGAFVLGSDGAEADTNLGSVAGISYVSDTTESVAAPFYNEAIAACPSARPEPLGGGIYPSGDAEQAWVEDLDPWGGPQGWWGRFRNVSGPAKTATVFAMCTGRRVKARRAGGVPVAANDSRVRRARCPKDTHVTGGGATFHGVGRLVSSYPFDGPDANRVPDDGWAVRYYNLSTTNPAYLYVDAICLARKRLRYKKAFGAPSVECPNGGHLTGGGIRHPRGVASSAWMNTSAPIDTTGDIDSIPDDIWYARATVYPRTVYGICLVG